MPGPKPPEIVLTTEQRAELDSLVRAHTSGQQAALRARIVLLAADGWSTEAIGRHLHIDSDTVRLWRARWGATSAAVTERLADAPKSGRPVRFTPEQICAIMALACECPAEADRPITHWSARELADESISRGIVDRISPRHIGRVLKSGRPQAPPDPLLAHPARR
jgi:transposase